MNGRCAVPRVLWCEAGGDNPAGKEGTVMICKIPILLLLLAALTIPHAAGGGQPQPAEPRYDTATTVEFTCVVTEVYEVARRNPMHGVHLKVDTGRETVDVYLGPTEFMKQFDFTFAKGDRVDIAGSKVKAAGATVVLAKEVRRQSQTVYLRDSSGAPYWPQGS